MREKLFFPFVISLLFLIFVSQSYFWLTALLH